MHGDIIMFGPLSDEIFLGIIASIGVALYAGFAYLVAHSKNIEMRRRWRYSILWGVTFGVFTSILFGILSVLSLLGAAFQSPRSLLDLFPGIFSSLVTPVILSLPFVFLVTFGTYWKQLGMGDLFINQLLYPVKKHFSDQSTTNSVFDRMRSFIAKLID